MSQEYYTVPHKPTWQDIRHTTECNAMPHKILHYVITTCVLQSYLCTTSNYVLFSSLFTHFLLSCNNPTILKSNLILPKWQCRVNSGCDASVCDSVLISIEGDPGIITLVGLFVSHGGNRRLLYGWVMTVFLDYGVAGEKLHTKHKDTHPLRYCISSTHAPTLTNSTLKETHFTLI